MVTSNFSGGGGGGVDDVIINIVGLNYFVGSVLKFQCY